MKKTLFFSILFGVVFAGLVFGADIYSVQNITGRVDRLGAAGQWIAVSVGDTLSPSTTIKIGIDAVLVIKDGDTERTLRSVRQGTLESFLGSGTVPRGEGRISVGGNVINSNAAVTPSGTPKISTRAFGEAEIDWAE